jgi:hypothetical protein
MVEFHTDCTEGCGQVQGDEVEGAARPAARIQRTDLTRTSTGDEPRGQEDSDPIRRRIIPTNSFGGLTHDTDSLEKEIVVTGSIKWPLWET